MTIINSTVVSLRISGDDLSPEDITNTLGCFPSHEQVKGQIFVAKKTKRKRTAQFGLWILEATENNPGDLDSQIYEILDKLTDNIDSWVELADNYQIDLYCGLFMEKWMEGICISSESMQKLGERKIELGLDIYCPDEEENKNSLKPDQ